MEKMEVQRSRKSMFHEILPILLCGLSIPLSIFLWIGNLAFSLVTKNSSHEDGKCYNDYYGLFFLSH